MSDYEDDDSRDEEANDEDVGLVGNGGRPMRRRRRRAPNDGGGGSNICTTLLVIVTMVAVGVAGLWIFQKDGNFKSIIPTFSSENNNPNSNYNEYIGEATNPHKDNSSPTYGDAPTPARPAAGAPIGGGGGAMSSSLDTEALNKLLKENNIPKHPHHKHTVRYDPSGHLQAINPFDFKLPDTYGSNVLAPPMLFDGHDYPDPGDDTYLGYFQHPDIVKNTLVFCAEGDVFVTTLSNDGQIPTNMPATKLTTTIGNVLDPKLHPSLRYLAYTATYTGRRDIYLMDLYRPRSPAMRLTYWDVYGGVSGLIGWWGNSLVFRAMSNSVSLRDMRLYVLHLDDGLFPGQRNLAKHNPDLDENVKENQHEAGSGNGEQEPNQRSSGGSVVMGIEPVPLSQAIDAARHRNCWYFVRYSQSSQTIRYVGGTAEQLWRYCQGDEATPLIPDGYKGTSKSPRLYKPKDSNLEFLLFLSDRGVGLDGNLQPDRMNIWALDLKHSDRLPIKVTDTKCDFEGRLIREFAVDAETGNIVVRLGADLYVQTDVRSRLENRRRRRLAQQNEGNGDEDQPTPKPTEFPSASPSTAPSPTPSNEPSTSPSVAPSTTPSSTPSTAPSTTPSTAPSTSPSAVPSTGPSTSPSLSPSVNPSTTPSTSPSTSPSSAPTDPESDGDGDGEETEASDKDEEKDSVTKKGSKGDNHENEIEATSSPSPSPTDNESIDNASNSDGESDGENEIDGDSAAKNTAEDSPPDDDEENATASNQTQPEEAKVFYSYSPPELDARASEEHVDHFSGNSQDLTRLPIVVHSDFSAHQERLIPVSMTKHMTSADVYETAVGTASFLMTLRGQLWVAPIVDDEETPEYEGSGMNMPHRQYRVAPGSMMGGSVRILKVIHVPNPVEDDTTDRRLAVILATDPVSETAEQAFYLIETQPGATPMFLDFDHLPRPFLGGHMGGGSAKYDGLGSVKPNTMTVSPCGRRLAWSDTDGRIAVMNMPQYQETDNHAPEYVVLPNQNELGEPMVGDEVELCFSPGGRYLAVNHNARNQFTIISIADLGDPAGEDRVADINIGRIVQATPSEFNSESMYWGKSTMDIHALKRDTALADVIDAEAPKDVATTLYFLTDGDILTDVRSPWGTRQPMPHFKSSKAVYALPFVPSNLEGEPEGRFTGGGASELQVDAVLARKNMLKSLLRALKGRRLSKALDSSLTGVHGIADGSYKNTRGNHERLLEADDAGADESKLRSATFPTDMDIDFGPVDLTFSRHAYRLSNIPEGDYDAIVCQTSDDGTLVLIEDEGKESVVKAFMTSSYPSDVIESKTFQLAVRNKLVYYGLSTSREYFYLGFTGGTYKVVPNSAGGILSMLSDSLLEEDLVNSDGMFLSVWPSNEYRQMYSDAWRMLRDYFYDPEMTQIDWPAIHERYLPLVSRCTKREELDDVLAQMASELSALHVFVYGGEYNSPVEGIHRLINEVASLGARLQRAPEWKGYMVVEIPKRDPDFGVIDGTTPIYSPLSDQNLRLSGQKGLKAGDVIVGINGESVMRVPDINMLLRGMAGRSVRLDVLRLASGANGSADADPSSESEVVAAEPLITVPLDPMDYDDLLYYAWEYKTKKKAEKLAKKQGFTVGYIHMQSMSGVTAEDAFARGFYPNYNKDALILDVRHNRGGNIDSWVLDVLQRKAWMYWQSRDFNPSNGGLGWDEQFAFRGHVVVLIDEKTSSDGEGVSRGISELGLGRLIGTRTWGGGIWLSSDNHLVDGGIATAPEVGTFNDNFGWGLGIEQMGVEPDSEVDNEPHSTFEGSDAQLEFAIEELKKWLVAEPVVVPKPPAQRPDKTMQSRECSAHRL